MHYDFHDTDDMSFDDKLGFIVRKRTYNDTTEMSQNHYHYHYEILHISENSRKLQIGTNEYELNKNNVALIPPFIPHMTLSGGETPQTRFLINFRTDFVNKMEQALGVDLLACFNPVSPVVSCEPFLDKFCTLTKLIEEDYNNIEADISKSMALLHLSELLLLLSSNNVSTESKSEINEIIQYIEKHFNEQISLEALEKIFYTSRYTISRKFNAMTGLSIPKYVSIIRIIHAKQFIEKGMNLTDTALSCGFNSLNDFERVFRSETGTSPLKYKKSIEGGKTE